MRVPKKTPITCEQLHPTALWFRCTRQRQRARRGLTTPKNPPAPKRLWKRREDTLHLFVSMTHSDCVLYVGIRPRPSIDPAPLLGTSVLPRFWRQGDSSSGASSAVKMLRIHRQPFGQIAGPGKWNKTNLKRAPMFASRPPQTHVCSCWQHYNQSSQILRP